MSASTEPTRKGYGKAKPGPSYPELADMVWHKRTIHMYAVPDSELRELTSGYNSLHLVLFGICLGVFVSLLIAYKTANLDEATKPYFMAGVLVSCGLSLWCGIGTIKHYKTTQQRVNALQKEEIVVKTP